MKIKVNDKIVVIAGKDKGKVGRVTRVVTKQKRLVVEGVNMRTKHIKKTQNGPGEKIRFEAPLDCSNVMILDPKENKPTRIGYRMVEGGKKERFAKLSGSSLDIVTSEEKETKVAPVAEKPATEKKSRKKTTIKA